MISMICTNPTQTHHSQGNLWQEQELETQLLQMLVMSYYSKKQLNWECINIIKLGLHWLLGPWKILWFCWLMPKIARHSGWDYWILQIIWSVFFRSIIIMVLNYSNVSYLTNGRTAHIDGLQILEWILLVTYLLRFHGKYKINLYS